MLHSNYIQILLNLKDVSIINFSDSSVTIQLPRKPHLCPCCHHTTNSVHDYRLQKIHHLRIVLVKIFTCKKSSTRVHF